MDNDMINDFMIGDMDYLNEDIGELPEIVVIDDDDFILESLDLVFRDDYKLVLCSSGEEGIAAIHRGVYAVILDIKMQGKDGFETFLDIKRKNPYLPIIFHSAYNDLEDPYIVINKYRPFAYITKGANNYQIEDTLRSAIDYYRQIRKNEILIARLESLTYALESRLQKRNEEVSVDSTTKEMFNIIDTTTGAYTKSYFLAKVFEALDGIAGPKEGACLIIVQIDDFNHLTDVLDIIELGNEVKKIVDCINDSITYTHITGRMKEDEFAVFIQSNAGDPLKTELEAVCSRIKDSGADLEGLHKPVTVSIGYCMVTDKNITLFDLYSQTKHALKHSINKGGSCITLYEE